MFVEIANVLEFLKQSRIPGNSTAEIKTTTMCILSKCGGKKALPEAFIHMCPNFTSGMHNFKHFYSSIYCQHNHQCLTQDSMYKCMGMHVCIHVKYIK